MGKIREGELYKRLELFGRAFELYYGYYEDYERERGEPVPIYPDFQKSPEYTPDGYPFVTQMQGLCSRGESRFSDGCCIDCGYYRHGEDLIGICVCDENKYKGDKK